MAAALRIGHLSMGPPRKGVKRTVWLVAAPCRTTLFDVKEIADYDWQSSLRFQIKNHRLVVEIKKAVPRRLFFYASCVGDSVGDGRKNK